MVREAGYWEEEEEEKKVSKAAKGKGRGRSTRKTEKRERLFVLLKFALVFHTPLSPRTPRYRFSDLSLQFPQSLHRSFSLVAFVSGEGRSIGLNMHAVVLNSSPYTRAPQPLETPSSSRAFKVPFHFSLLLSVFGSSKSS